MPLASFDLSYSGHLDYHYFNHYSDSNPYHEGYTSWDIYTPLLTFHVDYRKQTILHSNNLFIPLENQHQFRQLITLSYLNSTVKAGQFYTSLGKGLIFSNFEKREFLVDQPINGLYGDYLSDALSLKIFHGYLTTSSTNQPTPIWGGEVMYNLFDWASIGGAYASFSDDLFPYHAYSAILSLSSDLSHLYFEYANSDRFNQTFYVLHSQKNLPSRAYYLYHDMTLFGVFISTHYKDYQNMNFSANSLSLNPLIPPLLKQHAYTLIARSQSDYSKSGIREKGFLSELDFSVFDTLKLSTCFGSLTNQTHVSELNEHYSQLDFDPFESFVLRYGYGQQIFPNRLINNHILDVNYSLSSFSSIQAILEYQTSSFSTTQPSSQNTLYTLSTSLSSLGSLALLFETTTDPFSSKESWLGMQLDFTFFNTTSLSLFSGSRKAGKSCMGGICIYKPEFDGLELIVSNRF